MRERTLRLWTALFVCILPAAVAVAYPSEKEADPGTNPLIAKVEAYRTARHDKDWDKVKSLLSEDSRIWFEKKEGPGRKRKPTGGGPWSEWDRYFNARSEIDSYHVDHDTVCVMSIETNDFYRLIDRQPKKVRVCYFFDTEERIAGTLIQAVEDPDAPADRFDEFKEWAAINRPEALADLMPEGEIVPGLEEAKRWRRILTEWRAAVDLPPVE